MNGQREKRSKWENMW